MWVRVDSMVQRQTLHTNYTPQLIFEHFTIEKRRRRWLYHVISLGIIVGIISFRAVQTNFYRGLSEFSYSRLLILLLLYIYIYCNISYSLEDAAGDLDNWGIFWSIACLMFREQQICANPHVLFGSGSTSTTMTPSVVEGEISRYPGWNTVGQQELSWSSATIYWRWRGNFSTYSHQLAIGKWTPCGPKGQRSFSGGLGGFLR